MKLKDIKVPIGTWKDKNIFLSLDEEFCMVPNKKGWGGTVTPKLWRNEQQANYWFIGNPNVNNIAMLKSCFNMMKTWANIEPLKS